MGFPFRPDYTVPPGRILRSTLSARGIDISAFAVLCGLPGGLVEAIIAGEVDVTPEAALAFGRVLDTPAAYWTNLQALCG